MFGDLNLHGDKVLALADRMWSASMVVGVDAAIARAAEDHPDDPQLVYLASAMVRCRMELDCDDCE